MNDKVDIQGTIDIYIHFYPCFSLCIEPQYDTLCLDLGKP